MILSTVISPVLAASQQQNDLLSRIFVFDRYSELVQLLQNSILAGAVLGIIGGFVGMFVMMRDHAFAVHGVSEMSFAGAALALLLGYDVITGSMIGSIISALLIGMMGVKKSESNSVIGALMPFGLGLGILFLSLYQGRSANKFSLLTGQIVSVDGDRHDRWGHCNYRNPDSGLAATELRFTRSRSGPGKRRSYAYPIPGLYGGSGYRRSAFGSGRWLPVGAGPLDYSVCRGASGDCIPA